MWGIIKTIAFMKIFIASTVVLFLLITSCAGDASKEGFNTATGKVGEILVVTENGVWESDIRECLDSNLTQWIMPYFPDVATFELIHKTPAHFEKGVKSYRNILFVKIDPEFEGEKGKIVKHNDVWARGQVVIDITAKDYAQLEATCVAGLDEVHDIYDQSSWERLITYFDSYNNKDVQKAIAEEYGIEISLPARTTIVTKRNRVYRLEFPPSSRPMQFEASGGSSEDIGQIFSGLVIYDYDFVDSTQFDFERLLRRRDTTLKYAVPHEIDGLYMGTQYSELVYPEGNWAESADGKVTGYDIRGMFVFTGKPIHSTGGAFWEFHFKHPKRNKMMCLSGYVDAPPTTSWTQPLREVQAILRSVKIK
ncbi:MAG: hypothetical protein Crog4KO_20690 [Crocinitomicaceae bacterium]